MLVKVVAVGRGGRWHIARSELFTYCGAKPDKGTPIEKEMARVVALCANCKREKLKEEKCQNQSQLKT